MYAFDIDDRRPAAKGRQLDPSVYTEIERTCPRQDILPHIQSFSWFCIDALRQQKSLLFMRPTLRHLAIHVHRSDDPPLGAYVQGILQLAPGLTKLEIRSQSPMRDIQPELLELIGGLRDLRHIIVPMYFLTEGTMAELSKVPRLEIIELAAPIERGIGDTRDVSNFRPAFVTRKPFPALRRLAFTAHLQHASEFLNDPSAPRDISSLYLYILAIDNPHVLDHLLSILATQFKLLTEVYLDFVLGPSSPIVTPPPPSAARPSLHTLRPLLSHTHLVHLELRWDYQLGLTEADLEHVAGSWPALEVLHLNSEPIPEQPVKPILTARALLPFARHCRRLRSLALYLDGDKPADLHSHPPPPVRPFRALEVLAFGSSPLSKVEPIVLFLSHLCPLACRISPGVRWPDAYGIALDRAGVADERRLRMSEWWGKWNEVGRVLPLVIKARMDERARVAAATRGREDRSRVEELELEVQKLRLRLGP